VLQLYFLGYAKSLKDPYIDTWSDVTYYHSDFYTGSIVRICSPFTHTFITPPLYRLIHDYSLAKHEWDVYHLWISTSHNFSILNGHCWPGGKLIPGHRPLKYFLMLQWSVRREMRCRWYVTTMASWDKQGHMRDKSLTNNRFIGVLSTEWTYTNRPLVRPHSLCLGE